MTSTYLSFVSLTALTYDLKLNSPIHLKLKSSHKNTLFIENFGFCPPPTSAKMLVLNIISTIPIPPSSSVNNKFKLDYIMVKLTSFMTIFKRIRIKYFKTTFGAACETTLVLIKACE